MELALFDLDNTLLAGDSDHAWGQFLIEEGILDRQFHQTRNDVFYAQYCAGTLDIAEYLAFQSSILASRNPVELEIWRQRYMKDKIQPMILPKARALIEAHRGAEMAIITATNRFVTELIAKELGVDTLIACELERDSKGQFTGRATGIPSFQEGKVTRLEQWLQQQGKGIDDFSESYFYSDSLNDLPLLRRVSKPVVVDPDPTLYAHAKKAGWPIISLR